MEQIRTANIPLRLKNVKNPEGKGTIIYPSQSGSSSPKSLPMASGFIPNSTIMSFMSANGYYGNSQSRRAPTAITSKENIVLINVQSNREKKSHGFLAQVFRKLDEECAVADLVFTCSLYEI
jgi:aspartate kinase